VSGASRGIGKGIALELGAAGATVYATGRTAEPVAGVTGSLAATCAEIENLGGTAVPVAVDHSDDEAVRALFERVATEQGRLDVLVNCVFDAAGFRATIGKRFWELPASVWDDVVGLGTRSAYVAAVHAAPMLLRSERGLIVNVSARGAAQYKYNVAYGVGKAALDRMTADMAVDLEDTGVSAVSIWPGTIRTEQLVESVEAGNRWAIEQFGDLDRLETPRYVGRAVAALAADPEVHRRSGRKFWSAELAADYGLTDEFGRTHDIPT
jgi:NAD(P)-dependent dehydrogenase (short-subunit alcohol dehydrogenase family)